MFLLRESSLSSEGEDSALQDRQPLIGRVMALDQRRERAGA